MSQPEELQRRDFIYYATAGAATVVTGAAVWPLINQMNPSADILALSSVLVDVTEVQIGTQITVLWQGKPVFIRARSEEEIIAAREVDISDLIDPIARNANILGEASAVDENRALTFEGSDMPEGTWLLQVGICTHLGCVPLGEAGDFGGWFCPCHGSHYDTAGRIRRGPAPKNMLIPIASFVDENTIRLG